MLWLIEIGGFGSVQLSSVRRCELVVCFPRASALAMGKKGRKRTFKGRKGKGGGGKGTDEWHSSRGKTVVKENAQFEAFYKHQKVVPEDEWDAFLTSLKTSLPSCFRVPNGRYADQVRTTLATDTFGLDGLELKSKKELFEGNEYTAQPPAPVDWLPEGYAWVFNIPRPLIRKSPQLKAFHQWMIQENASGNINRQEAVSMIPPLLLDVQCGHSVLDMCAAPGSKTAQIVDALHEEGKLNSGLCVANDADNKRAFLLTHQLKRFGGDSLLVSNHQGQRFPKLRPRPKDREAKGESGMEFDRVLCDVPCCGDGTVRKAPEMWKKWNYGMGPGLHKLQLAILIRGLELLKPGGRLVYSTCTMNPYENEVRLPTTHRLANLHRSECGCSLWWAAGAGGGRRGGPSVWRQSDPDRHDVRPAQPEAAAGPAHVGSSRHQSGDGALVRVALRGAGWGSEVQADGDALAAADGGGGPGARAAALPAAPAALPRHGRVLRLRDGQGRGDTARARLRPRARGRA